MNKIASIENILDDFLEDLDKGVPSIIENETILKKTYFEHKANRDKKWKSKRRCSFPNCNNKTIKKSHTISKSSSLQVICEDGFLLTPSFSHKIGGLEMKPIGIGEASTFPGLCEVHENIFSSFENRGYFKDDSEVGLQLFRSVLRERFRIETELEFLQKIVKASDRLLENELRSRIAKIHGETTAEEAKDIGSSTK